MTRQQQPDWCRLVVINEIAGGRFEIELPATVEETLENSWSVILAKLHIDRLWHSEIDGDVDPVGVTIRYTDNSIVIRWFSAVDDLDSARVRLQEVLHGWDDGKEGAA